MTRWLPLLLLAACAGSDDSGMGDDDTGPIDTGDRPDPVAWTVDTTVDLAIGARPRLAATPGGDLVAVAFATEGERRGTCEDGAPRTHTDLHLLTWDGAWTSQVLASPAAPLGPTGVGLAVDVAGGAWVTWADGEPLATWCGGHDLVMASPDGAGGYRTETVVSESGEAATGEPASDAGSVVGLWSDIAFDPSGNPAVAYRDAHFGALQRDDRYRSDAELAWRTGGWTHQAVDAGAGAGDYNRVAFDLEGRPIVATVLPIVKQGEDRQGLWVARRVDGAWEREMVHAGEVGDDVVLRVLPNGDVVVGAYIPDDAAAVLYRHEGGAWNRWRPIWVARDGWSEGRDVDLDVTSDGRLVAAFHTCGRLSEVAEGSCDTADEGPRLAVQDGAEFEVETIHLQGDGACGREISLALVDDVPHVVFRCSIETDGSYEDRLLHAVREEAL